jgi:hypothetical protein
MQDNNLMKQLSVLIEKIKHNPKIEFSLRGDEMQIIAKWCVNGIDYAYYFCFSINYYDRAKVDISEYLVNKFNYEIDKCLECKGGE